MTFSTVNSTQKNRLEFKSPNSTTNNRKKMTNCIGMGQNGFERRDNAVGLIKKKERKSDCIITTDCYLRQSVT
jgi:hypothetical protein